MARPRERAEQREVALERISLLFRQAGCFAVAGDVESASKRVVLARNISMRCNVSIPKELKHRFCRKCLTYHTSANSRRRLNPREHRVEVKCLTCGRTAYLPYAREKKKPK
jgi:ribonuclease P protein subunit RPR2